MTDTPTSRPHLHEQVRLSLVDGSQVEGAVDTSGSVRLSDILNDRPQHLAVHCVAPDGTGRLVLVRKSAVVLALSDEHPPPSDMRVPKHPSLLLVAAGHGMTIAGQAHVTEGADPVSWLAGYSNRFLPMTEAQVKFSDADGSEQVQASRFALLGLDHATTLTFEDALPPWAVPPPSGA